MEKYLVTGSQGPVGAAVLARLAALNLPAQGVDWPEINPAQPQAAHALLRKMRPTYIIHCPDCNRGEEAIEPGKLQSQVEFVRSLAEAAAQQSLRFLYVSTALVFSGKSRDPYKPSDSPDPQNPIAWAHWQSEWAVAEQLESYQIVRSSWVYGGGGNDWISMGRDALKRGEKVYGREDEIGTPTSVADLAQVLVKLTRTEASGVFHVAASGYCSRRECLCRVAEFLDLNSDLVQPLSESDTAERDRPAIRTVLDCTQTWTLGIPPLPLWEKGLRSFINQQE